MAWRSASATRARASLRRSCRCYFSRSGRRAPPGTHPEAPVSASSCAYNLLTLLKRRALPERFRLARPKRLRFEIFNTPARLSVHQSQLSAQVSASRERTEELVLARQRLLAARQALA